MLYFIQVNRIAIQCISKSTETPANKKKTKKAQINTSMKTIFLQMKLTEQSALPWFLSLGFTVSFAKRQSNFNSAMPISTNHKFNQAYKPYYATSNSESKYFNLQLDNWVADCKNIVTPAYVQPETLQWKNVKDKHLALMKSNAKLLYDQEVKETIFQNYTAVPPFDDDDEDLVLLKSDNGDDNEEEGDTRNGFFRYFCIHDAGSVGTDSQQYDNFAEALKLYPFLSSKRVVFKNRSIIFVGCL